MPNLFRKAVQRAIDVSGFTKEELAYRVLPSFLLDLMEKYLRVKAVGLKNIPRSGPCIVIANHSGYMGFDALMLGYEIFRSTGRVPRIIAHKLWFIHPDISVHIKKLGLVPATYENGKKILEKGEILVLFPEGEEGNFKPSRERYHLKKFRRGFMRLALSTGAPILPAIVLGAEETHITVSQIRWAKELFGILIPVPLNVVPLPAKWKILFYRPVQTPKDEELLKDMKYITAQSKGFRKKLQARINKQLKNRKTIFL